MRLNSLFNWRNFTRWHKKQKISCFVSKVWSQFTVHWYFWAMEWESIVQDMKNLDISWLSRVFLLFHMTMVNIVLLIDRIIIIVLLILVNRLIQINYYMYTFWTSEWICCTPRKELLNETTCIVLATNRSGQPSVAWRHFFRWQQGLGWIDGRIMDPRQKRRHYNDQFSNSKFSPSVWWQKIY